MTFYFGYSAAANLTFGDLYSNFCIINVKQKQPGAVKKKRGQAKKNQKYRVALEMAGKNKG